MPSVEEGCSMYLQCIYKDINLRRISQRGGNSRGNFQNCEAMEPPSDCCECWPINYSQFPCPRSWFIGAQRGQYSDCCRTRRLDSCWAQFVGEQSRKLHMFGKQWKRIKSNPFVLFLWHSGAAELHSNHSVNRQTIGNQSNPIIFFLQRLLDVSHLTNKLEIDFLNDGIERQSCQLAFSSTWFTRKSLCKAPASQSAELMNTKSVKKCQECHSKMQFCLFTYKVEFFAAI